ncbi:MAG: integrase, partial [Elusimicrobia bacterium CG08_land_8_20_14_0_20_59_10]
MDTVHQGNLDGVKGVYHINLVDEVTQWEVLVCVPEINEIMMEGAVGHALTGFPFVLRGFHSDN